jgi:anti-sigma regulatory factor (Ser/Thr protein kinase)
VWVRDFPGRAFEVGEVRRWVSALLPDCGPREDVALLATETCTNAVVHTRSGLPGGRFSVHVEWSPELARVVVGDQGSLKVPGVVASAGTAGAAESGRGLLMVDEIADDWGTACYPDGRCTWFDVRWRARGGVLLVPDASGPGRARFGGREMAAR